MPEHDTMSKIFRVALLIFATTFGIGLYALIGAPVLRIDYSSRAGKLLTGIASIGVSTLKSIPIPHIIPQQGPIYYKLTDAANDFPSIKDIILSKDFGDKDTREIVFTKHDKVVDGEALLSHFSNSELPKSLGHLLLGQRYLVTRDTESPRGTLYISTIDAEATYASMLQNEALVGPALMNLVHPTMSISEVRMLTQIDFASRKIGTIDARAITTSSDEPILIWGLYHNMLVIAGSSNDFIAATQK